ncbi:response regulator of citrate/malate metabolism [Orbus hercynius]|uniref:Transcriptional regulatory protein n=1 Tax=Orbus hercynius TaxID=593135 RepID=A0A495RIU8_9GAMM|nr:response regulator [Orbus hercynius]RKS87365.1 response regulator of citrate/malate metabolism [Orbus hercynius]
MINVLIVEDDPMVAELNKQYLTMVPGFKLVGQVNNGEDALHFIHDNPVSLLLLDVFMPKLNGLELLQHIRISYPNIDIIMVTAACDSESIQSALRLGVIDYMVKPFTFKRFRTALITYQERIRLLSSSDILDQKQLDHRIFSQTLQQPKVLPKGIEPDTLNKVRQIVENLAQDFAMSDLSLLSSLSRISLKKYINYLEESGELESYLSHLSVGRPVRMYSLKRKQ